MDKLKVLIVDDAYFMRNLLKQVFKEGGYEVIGEAKNGKEGIKLYFELNPDIVTMDIKMPELDGIETIKQIISKDPKAKILVITGQSTDGLQEQVMRLGASGFLKKPFQPAFVWTRIEDIINSRPEVLKTEKEVNEVIEETPYCEEDDFFKKELNILPEPDSKVFVLKAEEDNIDIPDGSFDKTYYDQHQLTKENAEKMEAERIQQERVEQERLERVKQERLERVERERLEMAELERIKQEQIIQQQSDKEKHQKTEEEVDRPYSIMSKYSLPKHDNEVEQEPISEKVLDSSLINEPQTTETTTTAQRGSSSEVFIRPPRQQFFQTEEIKDEVIEPILNKEGQRGTNSKGLLSKIKGLLGI